MSDDFENLPAQTSEDIEVKLHLLNIGDSQVESLCFIPKDIKAIGVFTHGFTSSKSSILSWGQRLSETGIATIIFDLPGHYLGSFRNNLNSFEEFKSLTPKLFHKALQRLNIENIEDYKVFLGGHSLGALMSLHALKLKEWSQFNTTNILVGLGLNNDVNTHFFETKLFSKTLNIRRQFVSPHLESNTVFKWIKEQKQNLDFKDKKIILLSGEDDVVIGKQGAENLKNLLEQKNDVKLIKPKRLSHHQPELAVSHLVKIIREEL